MNAEDIIVWRNIAIIPVIVGTLQFLCVTLCREWVKSDLRGKLCKPVSVRWRFFASSHVTCAFRVIYADFRGRLHRARCRTYWHRRSVTWEDDALIDFEHETAA